MRPRAPPRPVTEGNARRRRLGAFNVEDLELMPSGLPLSFLGLPLAPQLQR
jgi:hypothetical protein